MGIWPKLTALGLTAALAMSLGACGGEDAAEPSVVISQTAQSRSLDPALADEPSALEPLWLVYTPLLSYRHAEGAKGTELIPALATDLPEVSGDGRTYALELRKDLEYSNGTPVQASDFAHAIKRTLVLDSPGAPLFSAITGATEFAAAGDPDAELAGIETDDESGRIEISLDAPDPGFEQALATTFAAPVPKRTPARDLTATPPPGVGPYEITSSAPGEEFVLERSENFAGLEIPEVPAASIDRITTRIVPSVARQAQDVLDNKLDYMQDSPPGELKPTILEQANDRYEEHAVDSTLFFFLNDRIRPFDNPLVREAVNRAIDRRRLALLHGATSAPGCALLAPGMVGYDESLDTSGCPYGDPERKPKLGRARDLIEQANARATRVTVWAPDDEANGAVAEAYAATLERIGLRARTKLVEPAEYAGALGAEAAAAQTGISGWSAPLPEPLDAFGSLGGPVAADQDPNPGHVDDPLIYAEVGALAAAPEADAVASRWAALDRYLVSPPQSYVAVYAHDRPATFFSERMETRGAVFHPIYRNDYSSWTLKEGE